MGYFFYLSQRPQSSVPTKTSANSVVYRVNNNRELPLKPGFNVAINRHNQLISMNKHYKGTLMAQLMKNKCHTITVPLQHCKLAKHPHY